LTLRLSHMSMALSLSCLLLLLLASCKPFEHKPQAVKGNIDISTWNFNKKGITPDGEWEFYWGRLYTPQDFHSNNIISPDYITIPSNWPTQTISNKKIPGHGYATFRLHIKGIPAGLQGIRMPDAYSNFKLWINDSLIATNGRVSNNPQTEEAELRPVIKTFISKGDDEIVIQVSNFYQHKGGLGTTPTFGNIEHIRNSWDWASAINIFLIGMLMILFFYHLLIFATTKNDYNSLLFAIVCLSTTLRCISTNERLINFLFPGIPVSLVTRVEYASVFGVVTFYGAFVCGMFPKDASKILKKFFLIFGMLQVLIMLFTPINFFTPYLAIYQVAAITQIIYFVVVTVKATYNREPLSFGMLLVTLLILAAGMNDVLYARLIVNTTFIGHLSIPLLLIVQAYFIAYRIGHALKSVEKLSGELNIANQNLEQKVMQRTAELESEKNKTDALLLNILPAETANELKEKGHAVPRTYSMVTVMFIKLSGELQFNNSEQATAMLTEIGNCFSAFDEIIEKHGVEKIKTIGDVYLCASGLPVPVLHHADNAIKAAQEIRDFMAQRDSSDLQLNVKIGATTGPVVAGIVGSKKFAYDIWGDTVNTSARLQQNSEPGMINISGNMHALLKEKFSHTYRGKIEAKNKGMIDMYYIN
jgi:class 3 adenylate cyclase